MGRRARTRTVSSTSRRSRFPATGRPCGRATRSSRALAGWSLLAWKRRRRLPSTVSHRNAVSDVPGGERTGCCRTMRSLGRLADRDPDARLRLHDLRGPAPAGTADSCSTEPCPRPYASVRPSASSARSRAGPKRPATSRVVGPRPFGGGSGWAAARRPPGSPASRGSSSNACPGARGTARSGLPTGVSIPHAALLEALSTTTVEPSASLDAALDLEGEAGATRVDSWRPTSRPTNAPSA